MRYRLGVVSCFDSRVRVRVRVRVRAVTNLIPSVQ